MAQLIALYKTPKDAKAFDAYYFSTHVPLAKKIPGLQKYEVSDGGVGGPGGGAYHLVALLSFNSAADVAAGLGAQHHEGLGEQVRALVAQQPRQLHPVLVGHFVLLHPRFDIRAGK